MKYINIRKSGDKKKTFVRSIKIISAFLDSLCQDAYLFVSSRWGTEPL